MNDKDVTQPQIKHYQFRKFLLMLLVFGLMVLASILLMPLTENILPQNDLGALIGLASFIFAGIVAWKIATKLMH